jgi:hypothetical protein
MTINVTIADFKYFFQRDFQYLPVWSNLITYNTNDIVYYEVTQYFYKALNDNITSIPTTLVDWLLLTSQQYKKNNYISDFDIQKAFGEASQNFNEDLFTNINNAERAYLYLTAHYLVGDYNAGGIQSTSGGVVNSRTVGNVSESYDIPDWFKAGVFSTYATTYYGRKYAALVKPLLAGRGCFTVADRTGV